MGYRSVRLGSSKDARPQDDKYEPQRMYQTSNLPVRPLKKDSSSSDTITSESNHLGKTTLSARSKMRRSSSAVDGPISNPSGVWGTRDLKINLHNTTTPDIPYEVPRPDGKRYRNILRRKPSTIGQHATSSRSPAPNVEPAPSTNALYSAHNKLTASINKGLHKSKPSAVPGNLRNSPQIIPELDRYRDRSVTPRASSRKQTPEIPHKLSTQDLPPPTPSYWTSGSGNSRYSGYSGYSASSSTRFSESPGPGAYSRDTTPSSMLSQSPSVTVPTKVTPRMKQISPLSSKPPLTNLRFRTAPEVEYAEPTRFGKPLLVTSSTASSNPAREYNQLSNKQSSTKAPTPPPRKSSHKFNNPIGDYQNSLSKASQQPDIPLMFSPSDLRSDKAVVEAMQGRARTAPPMRPSRDGAPDLIAELGDSMDVITSNLAHLNYATDRTAYAAMNPSRGMAPSPSPSIGSIHARRQSRASLGGNSTSSVRTLQNHGAQMLSNGPANASPDSSEVSNSRRGSMTRTPSPSSASLKTRFGFFGRRTKTPVETLENKTKSNRKGPAAGTGHEGYGRYAIRGRNGSIAPPEGKDRRMSGSISTLPSPSVSITQDPFLSSRTSPVIITGGGVIIENRNTSVDLSRTESNLSLPASISRPSIDSKLGVSLKSLTSSNGKEVQSPQSKQLKGRRLSKIDIGSSEQKPPVASRRSIYLANLSERVDSAVPRSTTGSSSGPSPAISNFDQSIKSVESLSKEAPKDRIRQARTATPKKPEKRSKSPRKWNFFQRSQAPSKGAKPKVNLPSNEDDSSRPIAHYAMMEFSEQEGLENKMGLDDIMREVAEAESSQEDQNLSKTVAATTRHRPRSIKPENRYSTATSRINDAEQESPLPIPDATPDLLTSKTCPVRTRRLPQVGRIPCVVSARSEQTSPKSFSRPFKRDSLIANGPEPSVLDRQLVAEPCFIGQNGVEINPTIGREPSSSGVSNESPEYATQEFMSISPHQYSEVTPSTSSGFMSEDAITAVVPNPEEALQEDEVWDEYDDLLIDKGAKKRVTSAASSFKQPFEYAHYESHDLGSEDVNDTATEIMIGIEHDEIDPYRRSVVVSSICSLDAVIPSKDTVTAAATPSTPMSFTDFISGYGDRNNSMSVGQSNSYQPSYSRRSSRTLSKTSNTKSVSSRSSQSTSSYLISIAEDANPSPLAQVNLRVSSMTVSKWLTFNQILFSPARTSLSTFKLTQAVAQRPNILTIDGLGNDDWSFYAAETYPQAIFYNLSPTSVRSSTSTANAYLVTPENHRQIPYTDHMARFPFPGNFFDAVIFRFPTASSVPVYKNLVTEAKRVLKPGGYLELEILDLDMHNMGPRTRRAVRGLKVKIKSVDETVCLGSTCDTIMRILGTKNFEEVKACKVGLPVVCVTDKKGARESLVEMLRGEDDGGIGGLVAGVGRWWWSRCYESGIWGADSIWGDAKVLKECERWGSGFKFLVCYARKPEWVRIRGASV
jgi:hypothetical protein